MQRRGYAIAVPEVSGPIGEAPAVNLTSGYITRALTRLPKQGTRSPWKLYQNYLLDLITFRYGKVDDGTMEFKRRRQARHAATPRGSV